MTNQNIIIPKTPEQIYNSMFDENHDYETTFFLDPKESLILGEFFYIDEIHQGWNKITVSKAEEYIKRMQSHVLSIKRKSEQKKVLSIIDRLVWAFGPEYSDILRKHI